MQVTSSAGMFNMTRYILSIKARRFGCKRNRTEINQLDFMDQQFRFNSAKLSWTLSISGLVYSN